MIKNYLLITLRSLMKNKLFIAINVLGMAISIGCCIVAYFTYEFNSGFDSNHLNASTIYRVNTVRTFQNEETTFGIVPLPLGNAIRENVKEVDQLARYIPDEGNFRVKDDLFASELVYVDPEFFNLFTYEFIEGSGDLSDRGKILISDELSEKFFGKEKALGKLVSEVLDSGKLKVYEVGGVFRKQPSNSSFYAQAYTNFYNQFSGSGEYNEDNWRYFTTVFLQITDPSRLPGVVSRIKPYRENSNKIREDFVISEFRLQPFESMGVSDSYNKTPGTWTREASPLAAIVGVGLMGIFILLISCFNLTNTAIAISSRRLKEIGIRKVMGSMRGHLVAQFIGETMLICFSALILGMLIANWVFIPAFNSLWPEMKITPDYVGKPGFLIFMIATLLFTGLLAGSYPAFYISKFQPTEILKGKLKFGGTNYFTRTLLTMQFAISLVGVVCSIAFIDNAKYQREFDLGFNQYGVIFTQVANRSEFETYRNALLQNEDITSIAGSRNHIYSNYYSDPVKSEGKEIEVDILDVGDKYIETLGMTLLAGRNFIEDSETDRRESVIVTEGFARKFGWDNPVGKKIVLVDTTQLYVVGMIKDVYTNGLWRELSPTMLRYAKKDQVSHLIVSASMEKIHEVNRFMETTWKELFPNKLYGGRMMDEEIVEANTVNINIVKMFVFLGIVAMLLSATGLFTLVSLNIIKRMKEIGVRKVLGASMANISRVINTEFAIILVIACVLGGFLGAWLSAMLMNSIWDYYQTATVATLIWSAVLMLVVSSVSVVFKIYNAVRLNPSHVLRDE